MRNVFDLGAIWNGPWRTGLKRGSFETERKRHYAMLAFQNDNTLLTFYPFTSKCSKNALLTIPPYTIPSGNQYKTSYLLNVRLISDKEDLRRRFIYDSTLPTKIYQLFLESHAKILKNRRKPKCVK